MFKQYRRHLFAGLLLATLPLSSYAFVSVGVSINIAPPALPVYEQPPCPTVGWIWTPGYWAWADAGYYWVPGTWIAPPTVGLLWTPGYWAWGSGAYLWHAGYWGPRVGFYGGVNYGFGYGGVGFEGGYWRGESFYYNRSVANLSDVHVTNVYNKTVINNVTVVNRVSYNGGTGGLTARPTAGELAAEHDHHVEFTAAQRDHEHMAASNHDLRAAVNGGKPRIAATERPNSFTGHGVVAAHAAGGALHNEPHEAGGPGHAPAMGARNDRPPAATGNNSPSHLAQAHSEPRPQSHEQSHTNSGGAGSGGQARPQAQYQARGNPGSGEPRPQVHNEPRSESRAQPHAEPRAESRGEPRGPSQAHGSGDPHHDHR